MENGDLKDLTGHEVVELANALSPNMGDDALSRVWYARRLFPYVREGGKLDAVIRAAVAAQDSGAFSRAQNLRILASYRSDLAAWDEAVSNARDNGHYLPTGKD